MKETLEIRLLNFFTISAAVLLTALGAALFICNWSAPRDYVAVSDPFINISFRYWFWAIGGLSWLLACWGFFGRRPKGVALWIAWLATNFAVFQGCLYAMGGHGLRGYLDSVGFAFGVTPAFANILGNVIFSYLLVGSYAVLLWPLARKVLIRNSLSSKANLANPPASVADE